MNPGEYLNLDVTAIAQRVRTGALTATEAVSQAVHQVERCNGWVNAVTAPMHEEAMDRAQSLDQNGEKGPLCGVPFLVKDLVQDIAGRPTSRGSQAFAKHPAPVHSAYVERLLQAGAVIIGKTNTPELALKAVTDSGYLGVCNNPWDLSCSPGGSSGGSASAVASGMVPAAGANDGGGSIRIPASCCGLFGLKPSRGLVPSGPSVMEIWQGASADLAVTRSVRDTALLLDVLSGPCAGDSVQTRPEASYVNALGAVGHRLRIGVSTASPIGSEVSEEAVAAVEHAASLLRRLGHSVEEASPAYDGQALARCYLTLYFGEVAATVREATRLGARRADFELLTRLLAGLGEALPMASFVESQRQWTGFARALADFHRSYDVLLTPTVAQPPWRHGQTDPTSAERAVLNFLLRSGLLGPLAKQPFFTKVIDDLARQSLALVPFTQLANLTGTPAMSVPLHMTPSGLPLGVQFIGRHGDDLTLLRLAAELEQAAPWFDRLPSWVRQQTTPGAA